MLPLALLALAPLRFHFGASEFANATYHVVCLTGYAACTNEVFTKFWNEEYHVTPADGARLDEWKAVMGRLENAQPPFAPAPFLPNYSSYYPSLALRTRILSTAMASKSGADFARRADFVKVEDARRLGAVLDHFERRLHPWWKASGERYARKRIREIESQARKLGAVKLASEAAAFLETRFAEREVFVHAIPSPNPKSKNATAIPLANHLCVELTDSFEPAAAAAVSLHELIHSMYDAAPPERHAALRREFLNSAEPAALPFYEFLNEAVATGMQLLLLDRNGKKDDDPYHDPFIPRLGMAAMPLIRDALSRRGSIFDGFAQSYLEAGGAALKEETQGPGFLLSSVCILPDKRPAEAEAVFQRVFAPRFTTTTEEECAKVPDMNTIRLVLGGERAIATIQPSSANHSRCQTSQTAPKRAAQT